MAVYTRVRGFKGEFLWELEIAERQLLALCHDFLANRLRPGPRVFIAQQRHRRNLARTMAAHAILLQNRRNIFVECDRGAGCGRREKQYHTPRSVMSHVQQDTLRPACAALV